MLNREELPLLSCPDKNMPVSVPSETALLEALSHLSSFPSELHMKPSSFYAQILHSNFFKFFFSNTLLKTKTE